MKLSKTSKQACFVCSIFILASSPVLSATTVPPGFEELTRGQDILLQVSLMQHPVGFFEAKVMPETIQFIEPKKVLAALQLSVDENSPAYYLLLERLTSPLARQGHLACSSSGNAQGCDYVSTDDLAVIYDENNTSAMIFLAKEWLPVEANKNSLYHVPTANSENALVHQQLMNLSVDNNSQNFSLQGNGALGVTEHGYMAIDWGFNYGRNYLQQWQGADLNNLFYRQGLGLHHYMQAGRMDVRDLYTPRGGNMQFSQLPIQAIEGIRVGSTLAYLNQEQRQMGTPLFVLLGRSARVEAYRGEVLLGTFYLPAGNNDIDTRSFPDGSYNVRLDIYEDNRLVRTETQPFTLTGQVGTESQWFIQGGALSSSRDHAGNAVHGGLYLPWTRQINTSVGVAILPDENFAETRASWTRGFDFPFLDGVLNVQASYLKGGKGSAGDTQQVNYNDGFSISAYRNRTNDQSCDTGQQRNHLSRIGCSDTVGASFSLPLASWMLNLGYSQSTNSSVYYQTLYPQLDYETVFTRATKAKSTLNAWQLSGSRSDTFKNLTLNTHVGLFHRSDGNDNDRGGYLGFTLIRQSYDKKSLTSVSSEYRGSTRESNLFTWTGNQNWYHDSGNVAVNAGSSGQDTYNATVQGNIRGQYGDASAVASSYYKRKEGQSNNAVTGSYSSSLAFARSGIYWGPASYSEGSAAIVVGLENLDIDNKEAQIDFYSNGNKRVLNDKGHSLMPVSAYSKGRLRVEESVVNKYSARSEIAKGGGERDYFLLPGKLIKHDVHVQSNYFYAGRMLTEQGKPLMADIALNKSLLTSGANGNFTLDTTRRTETLYVLKQYDIYQCPLKVKIIRDVVNYVDDITCENIQFADLPDTMREVATSKIYRLNRAQANTAKN